MNSSTLIASLRKRGFRLTVDSGSLRVAPASALTADDREAIRIELPALVAALSPGEPWDQRTALRLMEAADALVERLGVVGSRPEITTAATMVVNAYATRDVETLRFAVAEFTVIVRRLAASERGCQECKTATSDADDGKR